MPIACMPAAISYTKPAVYYDSNNMTILSYVYITFNYKCDHTMWYDKDIMTVGCATYFARLMMHTLACEGQGSLIMLALSLIQLKPDRD